PILPRATPCDELESIMDTYGTLEGTLQGFMIFFPRSGEAATVTRQILTLVDTGTENVHALYDLIPACTLPGKDGWMPPARKRQTNPAICAALTKVSSDVSQTVELTNHLAKAQGLPDNLYIEALQEAAEDAGAKIKVVEGVLRTSDGCA
ncbi:hypothetical protein QBC35DRAFT_396148, partial [Podospora australis]